MVAVSMLLFLSVFSVSRSHAQATTADVVGTVVDATGSVVPDATVVLTNVDTQEKRTATSNGAGEFVFTLLKPNHYSLEISRTGFKQAKIDTFNLVAGDRAREDSHLQAGAENQVVEVEGLAPVLQSDSSVLSAIITEKATQDLPLNGRNFYNMVQVLPGATEGLNNGLASGNRPDDRRQTSSVSVNGQADVINNQLIDGMDNNERVIGSIGVRPSIDAIQEVNVQTNIFTAEVGRSAGAIINVITKAGTNELHGTAYEFVRNTSLNANPYKFGKPIPKPAWHQNQFGGSLGGPILKGRTFFFGDYEGFRLVRGQNPTETTVPTAFERANPGNFTDNSAIGTIIAPAAFDPVGLQYFNLFPAPTSSGLSNNFTASPSYSQLGNTFDVRGDHRFNDSNLFFARFTWNRVNTNIGGLFPNVTEDGLNISPSGNLGSYPGPAKSLAYQGQLNYIRTLTPNLLLELKGGYTFLNNAQYPLGFGQSVNTAFGQPNINISPRTEELAPITISQGTSLGVHPPIIYLENTFQYLGSLNWTHGKQSIKFGAGVLRRQDTVTQTDSAAGSWTIANFETLLAGTFSNVVRNAILVQPHNRSWEPHVYFQDDWHWLPNLTLNLGVRYDLFTPYTEINNYLSNFDTDTGKIVVAGTAGVNKYGNIQPDYSNFAPRVGFAWTVVPKTVVRGGFGLTFAPENLTSGSALVNQPFTGSYGSCSSASTAASGCNPSFATLAEGLPLPVATSAANPQGSVSAALDPHFKSTYVEQTNLTVEREFAGTVASVTYVGEFARRMAYYLPDANAATPNRASYVDPTAATLVLSSYNYNVLRPYYADSPGVTSVPLFTSKGAGSYNAIEFVLKRRLSRGLDLSFDYVHAHNLDDSEAISNDGGDGFGSIPSHVSTLEYGNSNLDVRNRVAGTFNYNLPFGNSLRGFKGVLARGWQANGLVVWNTGLPFSETNITNRSGTRPGVGTSDRPNQIASSRLSHRTVGEWFNTAAFQAQDGGVVGNERRDQITGPGLERVDLSVFKTFDLTEHYKLEFRTEAFNVLNTAQFAFPTASLGNATNGVISSTANAYNPRIIQFAGKLHF